MSSEETYKVDPLQGSANYRRWKFSMRMVLQAKDLWEVASGEEEKPESGKAAEAWAKRGPRSIPSTRCNRRWKRTAVMGYLTAMGRCHGMAEPVGAATGGLAAKARCNGRLQRDRQ